MHEILPVIHQVITFKSITLKLVFTTLVLLQITKNRFTMVSIYSIMIHQKTTKTMFMK